ncbi:MAG: hypothetical protein COA47_08955 [Robiginitomaculum sp.]|nr:MAG: hypothetical protein COA47_08955 [Robiginitomaculum sp.]
MKTGRKFPETLRDAENIFYLQLQSIDMLEGDIWFVNNSDETLLEVSNSSGGFAGGTDGDVEDIVTMSTPKPTVYKDVKPKEAVRIDTYNEIFDGDFYIEFGAEITSPSFGKKHLKGELLKGGDPNATLLWTELPEMPNPDDAAELLSPEKAANDYVDRSGQYLDKSISLNRGDLRADYAAKRLAPSGLLLEKTNHRNGRLTEYKFSDDGGKTIFHTYDFMRACLFIEALRW